MAGERRRRYAGLRLRIAVLAAVAVGLALTAGAVLLIGLLTSRLDRAATTAATLRSTDIAALAAGDALPATVAIPGEDTVFVQVVAGNGRIVASSENIQGEPAITARRPPVGATESFTQVVPALDDRDRMRVAAVTVATPGDTLTVYSGENLDASEETARQVATLLVVGLPALAVFVGAVTWWAVGRALRPVRAITRTMAVITATDLHRRVPEPPGTDEIGELARTVNATLARLDTSVERQRRFVADASHELRGPLAAVRADLEISTTHPAVSDWTTVATDVLGDVERLQQLTDDLLLLARLDAERPPDRERVDLVEIVAAAAGDLQRDDLTVDVAGLGAQAIVAGDRNQLHRLARNLLGNAERHAHRWMRVAVERHTSCVLLEVSDDGEGIPPGERDRVFERFVRLDDARTRDAGGSGLGLAIVHDVAAAHGGHATITGSERGGARVVVEFPSRGDGDSDSELS